MKKTLITLTSVLITFDVIARVIVPFHGWDRLKNDSPYIAVVRCGNPIPPKPNVWGEGAAKSDSEIQAIFTLKGTNNISAVRLQTDHRLYPGQNYLVFGYCDNEIYQAYEDYRVVPLGRFFSTDSIAGKPLDDQIQALLQHGLDDLNRQMKLEQEEKARLEAGI